MLNIGCHLSSARGFKHMGEEALSLEANTFQFFTRNPRGSRAKAIDAGDARALRELIKKNSFAPLLAHAPYTLNPCSPDSHIREFARMVFQEDLRNMEYLPGNMYTFHPGSHVGQGVEKGIDFIIELLNEVLRPEQSTLVLLETMSGKGSEIGSFDEISQILPRIKLQDKMGVCLDTCHIYSAGHDIVNDLDGVLELFDEKIGLQHLKAIHLNDSMSPLASFKDRHAKIGEGSIGLETIVKVVNHPRLRHLPFLLETPNDLAGYGEEIRLLRSLYREQVEG